MGTFKLESAHFIVIVFYLLLFFRGNSSFLGTLSLFRSIKYSFGVKKLPSASK